MPGMDKNTILSTLKISQAQLARALNISRSAVAQWPFDKPIPEKQELRLRFMYPDIFGEQLDSKNRATRESA